MGSPDLEVRDDGTLVVEAPTVESALEAVQLHCGPDATIIEAEKVQSKGIAGFFAKQSYRVLVAPMTESPPTTYYDASASVVGSDAAGSPSAAVDTDVDAAVDVVLRAVEAGEHQGGGTFGEALNAHLEGAVPRAPAQVQADQVDFASFAQRREALLHATIDLRDQPAVADGSPPSPPIPSPPVDVVTPAPTVPSVAPVGRSPLGFPVDEWVPGAGPVQWSMDQLSRMGLPYRLIHGLADLDPTDDLAWVFRLAESASPLCGAMPDEAMLLIGRELDDTASLLGVDCVTLPEPPTYVGDVGVSIPSIEEGLDFVERVRAGRPIHLICDDAGFGAELLDSGAGTVEVVSTTPGALALALQIVVAADGVLGYLIDGSRAVRMTPFELALVVRSQLPRG